MKKRKISMAETAMTMERTFIQPYDMSATISVEEFMQAVKDSRDVTYPGMTIDPELAWELFKAMNLEEGVFGGNNN